MNIFSVLQRGNSSVREVTLTAWLSYLLDSNEDHGLSDRFLRYFIRDLNEQLKSDFLNNFLNAKDKNYTSTIGVEQDISPEGNSSSKIDIRIEISEISESGTVPLQNESFLLYVENKILSGSAKETQLSKYLKCLKAENFEHRAICYLTPDEKSTTGKLTKEYESIKVEAKGSKIMTAWLKWKNFGDGEQNFTILQMLKAMLISESHGEIPPITDYIRHTIKAMCFFIDDNDNFNEKPTIRRKSPSDIGAYRRKIQKHDLEDKVKSLVLYLKTAIENSQELKDLQHEILLDLNTYQDFRFIHFDFLSNDISQNFKIRFTVSIDSKNHHTNIAINSHSNAKGDKDKLEVVSEHKKETLNLNKSSNWYLRLKSSKFNRGKPVEKHKELKEIFMEYVKELKSLDQYL